jgi:hypothetical protein
MSRTESLKVSLTPTASLQISCIPSSTPPPLWDFRQAPDRSTLLRDLRVLEDEEYVYLVEIETPGNITTDMPELFVPDYRHGRTGRFRPGLNVGELTVTFFLDGEPLGKVSFEILSKKLSYLSDYAAMLKGIASYLAEIIAERFAPQNRTLPHSNPETQ